MPETKTKTFRIVYVDRSGFACGDSWDTTNHPTVEQAIEAAKGYFFEETNHYRLHYGVTNNDQNLVWSTYADL